MRVCSNCNTPAPEGAAFCLACGAPLSQQQAFDTPEPKRPSARLSTLAFVLLCISLVTIVSLVACYFAFFSPTATGNSLWSKILQPEARATVSIYLEEINLGDADIQYVSVKSQNAPLTDQNTIPALNLSTFSDRDKSLTLYTFDAVWNIYVGEQFLGEIHTKTNAVCHPTLFGNYPCRHVTSVIENPEFYSYPSDPTPPNNASPLDTFVNHCHERYFTWADISTFDEDMSLIARNSVFAHSGRKFQNERWQIYFSQFSWYTPRIDPNNFTTDMFNPFQTHNLQLILDYDKSMGFNTSLSSGTSNTTTSSSYPYGNSMLDYFVNHCHERYFTRAEISSFDRDMSLTARNAIYAHSGRIFQNERWRNYFSQYSWYYPYIQPNAFRESMLNDYQASNLKLILNYDKEMGYN